MIAVIVILVVLVSVAGHGILTYNRFARLRTEAKQAWANIVTELERRLDVMDNMVDLAREYAAHERDTFQAVTEARSALTRAGDRSEADGPQAVERATRRLVGVSERYPELKASDRYGDLARELGDSADRVTATRRYYNQVVATYNASLITFPRLIWARVTGARALKPYGDEQRGPAAGPRYGETDSRGSAVSR